MKISHADLKRLAIRQEIERSEESRYDHRLHALLLVSVGRSCTEVAQWFGESSTTVQRWLRRFEEDGFAGLHEGARPGRPRTLDARQLQQLALEVERSPREFGIDADGWDGPMLARHLERNHRVRLGVRQCQRLFKQIGSAAARAPGASNRPQALRDTPAGEREPNAGLALRALQTLRRPSVVHLDIEPDS